MNLPLTLGVNDAARSLGIGRTHLYLLIKQGKIETIQLGRRRLIVAKSLHRLVEPIE
ncbi:MAG: excisionase family DNA-binding protein [Sphingomonadaceae bacterium]|nr:excisionase family DNA-binding protein [Sphingomonadaceae bacterium]